MRQEYLFLPQRIYFLSVVNDNQSKYLCGTFEKILKNRFITDYRYVTHNYFDQDCSKSLRYKAKFMQLRFTERKLFIISFSNSV